ERANPGTSLSIVSASNRSEHASVIGVSNGSETMFPLFAGISSSPAHTFASRPANCRLACCFCLIGRGGLSVAQKPSKLSPHAALKKLEYDAMQFVIASISLHENFTLPPSPSA